MNPPGWCRVNIFGYIPRPVPRPLPWRHPTGFAGVFHATVLGLVVGWLAVVEVVDAGVVECVGMGVGSGWCPVPWAMCRVVATPPALASPFRLRRSVPRHSVGAGCGVVAALFAGGRLRCRWCGLRWCSMSWVWLLVEVWVVELPARGRRRCRLCVPQECS